MPKLARKNGATRRSRPASPHRQSKPASARVPTRRQQSEKESIFSVAAVGASAGGLEAFTQLLRSLPGDTGLAFVFILHLAPDQPSHLPEILAQVTPMPVVAAAHNLPLKPNQVYVIPSNSRLTLARGILQLAPRRPPGQPHMPIDEFCQSLAHDQGSRAIGIVLSGTATDGTLGLRAIKAEGGTTFAQDVGSAKFDGMPRSAAEAGVADFILPPDAIAGELIRLSRHAYVKQISQPSAPLQTGEPKPDALRQVRILLKSQTGIDFAPYKETTLARRIQRRMMLSGIETIDTYAEHLQHHPEEVARLHQDVFIHVTSFFRDADIYKTLQHKVFPRIAEKQQGDAPVRIWAPGCSTGEETYSLAIAWLEFAETLDRPVPIQIFGTDISPAAVSQARAGRYGEDIKSSVSPERLNRFFTQASGGYQIAKPVRASCVFAAHNLFQDPPFTQLDLLCCRNVMIFLDTDYQNRLISLYHYALRPSGFLVLGLSEDIGRATHLFATLDKKHRIYTKKPSPGEPLPDLQRGRQAWTRVDQSDSEAMLPLMARPQEVWAAADRIALAKYAPAGVVVDSDLRILQFRGHVGPYLEPSPGQPSYDLQKMARDGLQFALPTLVRRAQKMNTPVRQEGLQVDSNGQSRQVSVEVIPFTVTPETQERFFLVVFEGVPLAGEPELPNPTRARAAKGVKRRTRKGEPQLEQDLTEAREHLRTIIQERDAHTEELTAALEELQSGSEELQSTNEELQSTNEELQTAKEEVQSTNEELVTLNEELETRNREVNQTLSQLNNVLESVSIPIVWVDSDLRIRMFNPAAEKVLNVVATDLGRPISAIRTRLDVPELDQLINAVIHDLSPREQEVQDREGRWYTLRLRPFRTVDQKLDGVLLAWTDISALKASLTTVTTARDYLETIVETVSDPLLVLDSALRVQTANRSYYQTFQAEPQATENRLFYELNDHQWDLPQLRKLMEEILPHATEFENLEMQCDVPDLGRRTMLANARRLRTSEGSGELILLALQDITVFKQIAEIAQLRQLSARLDTAREEERANLSRDLHDQFGGSLTALKMELSQIRKGLADASLRERAQRMSEQIDSMVQTVRQISGSLRPSVLDDLGLRAAIEWQISEFQRYSGVGVHLTSNLETISLAPTSLIAAFRIFQEMLTNVARHAQATQVEVVLEERDDALILTVHDNGCGIDVVKAPASGSLGIAGMRERVSQLGGEFDIQGTAGKGTTVSAKIPLLPQDTAV